MPTVIGVVFLSLGVYAFFLKERAMFALLILSSIFQASSALKFGSRGIQPVYLIELLIILRGILNELRAARRDTRSPHLRLLLLFGLIAIVSAFVLPFIFAGTPVYDPLIGIDEGLLDRPPLHFGLTNVTQACFLASHIATVYALFSLEYSSVITRRGYRLAFYLVAFFVIAQALCKVSGLPFPDTWIRTNPDLWDLANSPGVTRKPASFLEPSFAGAFMVFCAVGFGAEYLAGRGRAWTVALSLAVSGMITSSGSLLTLLLSFAGLAWRYLPYRWPWYINLTRVRRLAWIVLIVAAPLALMLLFSADYRDILFELTVSKAGTGSFFNRTASDVFAIVLLLQTWMVGVGLGSNRASSLITSLASNVGLGGLVVFGLFVRRLFAGLPTAAGWLRWAGFALIINMCIDVPDVTFPMLWVAIMLALQTSRDERGTRSPFENRERLLSA